jgi:hypothetical protein
MEDIYILTIRGGFILDLEKMLSKFLHRLHELDHVKLLLPNEPLVVKFELPTGNKRYLYLSKSRSTVDDVFINEHATVFGSGIVEFINGTKKLSDLILEETIEVVGSMRNTLLIEAIFYLNREKVSENIG